MNIIKKLLVSFVIFSICWLLIIVYISNTVGIKGYQQLERENIYEEKIFLEHILTEEIRKDELLLSDWAAWDPIYDIVIGNEDAMPEGDLNKVFYVDQEINYVLLFDNEMNLKLEEGFDLKKEEYKDVPQLFIEKVSRQINQSGLINIDGEWIAYSTEQVTNSDETEMPEGLLVFAHTFDDNRQELIGGIIQKELVFSIASEQEKLEIDINFDKPSTIIGVTIPFAEEVSFLEAKYDYIYDIIALGKKTIVTSMFWFSLSFVIGMSFLYIAIRGGVKRLIKLRKDVENIRITYNLNGRVEVDGTDEIGVLGHDINVFIEDLNNKTTALSYLANYDTLTEVLNRRAGLEKVEEYIKKYSDEQFPLTICYIDIDGLKRVNDKLGHIEGDRYINTVVLALKKSIDDNSDICRLGGDEFMIIFPYLSEFEVKKEIIKAKKCLELSQRNSYYNVEFSYGILSYEDNMTSDTFIDAADAKMYDLKKKKKLNFNV